MQTRDLVANQITYLTYILRERQGRLEPELLRPTALCLRQLREQALADPGRCLIGQVETTVDGLLQQAHPLPLPALEAVVSALRQLLSQFSPPAPI